MPVLSSWVLPEQREAVMGETSGTFTGPLQCSDPQMWGVETPQCQPVFPPLWCRQQSRRKGLGQSKRDSPLAPGLSSGWVPGLQQHQPGRDTSAGTPVGTSVSVWCASGCLCWCETVEPGRLNPPAPTAEKWAGWLLCEGLCAGAGAGASARGAAVADSDSLPSSHTRLLAQAGSKLLFLEPPYWSVLTWLPLPPWAPRVWIWDQPKPEPLL